MKNIPTPCSSEVEKYLNQWNLLENYVAQENSLYKLFHITYPNNDDINDILIKASSLNDFFSTRIFSIYTVAKHILELDIDERIKKGDVSLINDIASVEINGVKKYFYSFATKYCSHHNSDDFPIFDNYVSKVLIHFRKIDNFYSFTTKDLKKYDLYKKILLEFKKFYDIDNYSLKEIDKYLWQLGKEYFKQNTLNKK